MDPSPPPPTSQQGTLHFIPPNLSAFEPLKPLAKTLSLSTLLWIGGLYDTPLSVSYPLTLAQALPPTWSLLTLNLSTSGLAWGVGSIAQDAAEMSRIVAWVRARRPGGRVVIMGHSTGCQDCMEYVVGGGSADRGRVEGVVLQAPVSDRQWLENFLEEREKGAKDGVALGWIRDGRGEDVLPNGITGPAYQRAPLTARRWLDVSSPAPGHEGADDYFSSDLGRERLEGTFGRLPRGTALLILQGGDDPSIPPGVDRRGLVDTWSGVVRSSGGSVDEVNSGVIPGASHNLNGQADEIVQDLIGRVVGFVDRLDRGEIGAP